MKRVEELYDGDKRLDNLENCIIESIFECIGGRKIPIITVVGMLDNIKLKFLKELEEK